MGSKRVTSLKAPWNLRGLAAHRAVVAVRPRRGAEPRAAGGERGWRLRLPDQHRHERRVRGAHQRQQEEDAQGQREAHQEAEEVVEVIQDCMESLGSSCSTQSLQRSAKRCGCVDEHYPDNSRQKIVAN